MESARSHQGDQKLGWRESRGERGYWACKKNEKIPSNRVIH